MAAVQNETISDTKNEVVDTESIICSYIGLDYFCKLKKFVNNRNKENRIIANIIFRFIFLNYF